LAVQNDKDELGHLARSFNTCSTVSANLSSATSASWRCSHELRTGRLRFARRSGGRSSQQSTFARGYRESLGGTSPGAERLTHIVEDLFTLTRATPASIRSSLAILLDELAQSVCIRSDAGARKKIRLNFEEASDLPSTPTNPCCAG